MRQRNFEVCLHMGDLLFEERSSTLPKASTGVPLQSTLFIQILRGSAIPYRNEEPGGLSYHKDIFLVLTLCSNLVNVPNIQNITTL